MTTGAGRLLKGSGMSHRAEPVIREDADGQGAYMVGRAVTCTKPSISSAKLCTLLKPHFCFSSQIEVEAETCA